MAAYIYNVDTRNVHAVITGSKAEQVANDLADGEEFGVTFTPAFGASDGLIMCEDTNEYDTAGFNIIHCFTLSSIAPS